MKFSYKDKNGSVNLSKRGRIIVVELTGACGTRLIDFYARKLQEIAKTYQNEPWAYLCNGNNFSATTPEAQKVIVKTYAACMQMGCRYEAYCYNSPVGKAQTQKIMQDCGNNTDIEQVLFATEQLAEAYLLNRMEKLQTGTATSTRDQLSNQ